MRTSRVGGLRNGWVVAAAGALTAVAAAWIFAAHGSEAEGWRLLIRTTARISGAFFLAAFLAAPLRRLVRGSATAWLLRNRPGLGVSVGLVHAVHGVAIAVFVRMTGHETPAATLAAALVAYGFLAAMVATSFDGAARALGPRGWRGLHLTGLYYLWFVFGFTFGGTAAAGDPVSGVFAGLYVLALPLRLYGLRGREASSSSRSSDTELMQ